MAVAWESEKRCLLAFLPGNKMGHFGARLQWSSHTSGHYPLLCLRHRAVQCGFFSFLLTHVTFLPSLARMTTRQEREGNSKYQTEVLEAMLAEKHNKQCADCGARGPRWASTNLGCFLCIRCSGIHRNLGTHISKVRSVTLDKWSKEQVDFFKVFFFSILFCFPISDANCRSWGTNV